MREVLNLYTSDLDRIRQLMEENIITKRSVGKNIIILHRVMHPVNLLVVLYISRLEVGGYYPAMRALLAFCGNSWKGGQSEIYSQHSNNHRGNLNMSLSSNLLKLRQTDLLYSLYVQLEKTYISFQQLLHLFLESLHD